MPNPVSVIFNADTGQFVAQVDQATGSVTKQAQAVADAKNKILESLKAQTLAAKEMGATSQELERIQTKAAEGLANVTEKNANKVIAALDRVSEKNKRVAEELRNLPDVVQGESHGSESVTNKQKASALLRGGGLRAAEAFASQFDAFNAISTVAFPVVGAIAITKEVWAGVEALKAMYEAAEKLPSVLKDGFESIVAPVESSVDGLRKANDQLAITLAELEHGSTEKLEAALRIDEIRIAADKASESARKAYLDVQKLLTENKVSFAQQVLTGTFGSDDLDKAITSGFKKIGDLEQDHKDSLRDGTSSPDSEAEFNKKKAEARYSLRNYLDEQQRLRTGTVQINDGTRANYDQVFGNQDAPLEKIKGSRRLLNATEDQESAENTNASETANVKAAQDKQKQQQQGMEAARKAMEAQRKQWQAEDDARRNAGNDSALIETNTWALRVLAQKVGSEQYLFANHELAAKLSALTKENAEAAKQAAAKASKDQRDAWDIDHDNWSTASHRTAADEADYWAIRTLEATQGSENAKLAWDKYTQAQREGMRQAEEAAKARSKATLETGQQKAAAAEASLAIDVQTGRISKQDAAYALAAIHAEQYKQKLVDLNAELARQKALDPNSAGSVNAQAAVDKADADRKVQIMQDGAAEAAQSWQGALKNANALWVQDAMDSAKQIAAFYGQALNGVNENVTNAIVGDKTNFSGMFKGLGKTLVGDGLKRIEAPILGKLGLGKADGSKSNPLYVKNVDGIGGGFDKGLAGGLKGLFDSSSGGGPTDGKTGGASGFFSSLFAIGAKVVGGARALGGGVKAGYTYDVGEMGREEFTPETDGYITPNNRTGNGTASYAIYMDGGVTPEQVHQQISSALAAVHPKVVRDSANAVSERMARRPRSAGN